MLQSEQECQEHRHLVVEPKEGSSLRRLLHEREVWTEQKAIVIIAKESLSGQESSFQSGQSRSRTSSMLLRHDGRRPLIFIHFDDSLMFSTCSTEE